VPTCLDRLICQAIAQVLTPIFDPGFSGSSFGFRPGRSAHQAVKVARRCIQDGLVWVVDIGLDRFFDRVQFDVLMARVARKVDDRADDHEIRLFREFCDRGYAGWRMTRLRRSGKLARPYICRLSILKVTWNLPG
jgi:RNA-directed DNA polymerase